MNPAKRQNIKNLTNRALDLPAGERADFLARETDEEIRFEAEQLLAAVESAEDFIDEPFLIEEGIADDFETESIAPQPITLPSDIKTSVCRPPTTLTGSAAVIVKVEKNYRQRNNQTM